MTRRVLAFLGASFGAIVVVAAVIVVGARLTAYERIYNYDVRADQPHPLAERAAYTVDVDLTSEGFVWPELPAEIDTVFLTLEIASTFRGRWSEPWLEYGSNDARWQQYFSLNARGIRHIDLTPLLRLANIQAGERVAVRGHGLQWQAGTATIAAFANPPIAGRSVLVIAPHPDDAELAAFGLYSRLHVDVAIVTTTAGDAGSQDFQALFPADREQALAKGRVRVLDSITVPYLGGVAPDRVWNLGYFDGTIEAMYEDKRRPMQSLRGNLTSIDVFRRYNVAALPRSGDGIPRWAEYVEDLRAVIDAVQPATIVAPHPIIDAHSDHRFTTIALCEVLAQHPRPDTTLFLYMNTGIYSDRFPHGPRTSLSTLPPWFEDPLPFSSVYSETLTPEESGWKALALEANHDMRGFDLRATVPIKTLVRELAFTLWSRLTGSEEKREGDYRHMARPNEIFYVMPAYDSAALCGAFLDRWHQGFFRHYQ